jgi:hypothetical protein
VAVNSRYLIQSCMSWYQLLSKPSLSIEDGQVFLCRPFQSTGKRTRTTARHMTMRFLQVGTPSKDFRNQHIPVPIVAEKK